jgi:hypothetical protein
MDNPEFLLSIGSSIVGGLIVLAGWLLTVGRKFQILDDVRMGQVKLQQDIKEIERDIRNTAERVSAIEGKLSGAVKSESPLSLTSLGNEYLNESGMKFIIDAHRNDLLEKIKDNYLPTAYDVQSFARELINEDLEFSEQEENQLKNYAYAKGVSLNVIKDAGALYLRDIALPELSLKTPEQQNKLF